MLLGLLVGVLVQITMDRVHYGEWGASLWRYFLGNFGTMLARVIGELGFHDIARDIYRLTVETAFESSQVSPSSTPADLHQLTSQYFYVTRLPSMLVWPVLLLAVAGLARSVRRPAWTSSILVALILCNVAVMSLKGSKDFRLWLPLLPLIAPVCALGWGLVRGTAGVGPAPWRAAVSALLLLAALGLGVQTLLADNHRKFGGYWDAIRFVNETARSSRARTPGAPRVEVTSARHWAVFLQESRDVTLTKLPRDLDYWSSSTGEQRQADLDTILDSDWFLVHVAVLWNHPELSRAINTAFEVRAVFGDRLTYEDIGPVFVFSKPTGGPDARRLFRLHTDEDPDEYRRRRGFTFPITFTRELVLRQPETNAVYDHHEEVVLLGCEFEEMPGDGHGWITYHWLCKSEMKGDYTIVDRLEIGGESDGWRNAHRPAYGDHPTRSDLDGGWQPGWILEESYVVIAAADPYQWQLPYRPLGGAYRRGDLLPATLWIGLATFDAEGATGRMEPSSSGGRGWNVSADGLARVGGFFLPVQARMHVTDDDRATSD
ncbi:MAG: hypothetical protein E2O39_05140 [Planctomycetota bacterium]|nr:MAG: hypothetical protein E2O39_05140 [Planctomycetota bacterium]